MNRITIHVALLLCIANIMMCAPTLISSPAAGAVIDSATSPNLLIAGSANPGLILQLTISDTYPETEDVSKRVLVTGMGLWSVRLDITSQMDGPLVISVNQADTWGSLHPPVQILVTKYTQMFYGLSARALTSCGDAICESGETEDNCL